MAHNLSRPPANERLKKIEAGIAGLRQTVAAMDYVVTGTMLTRRMLCGTPSCRCKKNHKWRHGPYHDWTRLEGKRLVHQYLSKDEAKLIKQAIQNYRKILKITRKWEKLTLKTMEVKRTLKA